MKVWRESGLGRSELCCGRPLPFLLVDDWLICPWKPQRRRRAELLPDQAERLEAVRRLVAATRPLPDLAWVSVEAGVIGMPEPAPGWVARRMHDGMVVAAAG